MNRSFKGAGRVFRFTFVQNFKGKSFRIVFIVVAVLLFAMAFAVNILIGHGTKPNPIKKLYIYNDTSLVNLKYDLIKEAGGEDYKDLEIAGFEKKDAKLEDVMKKAQEDEEVSTLAVLSENKEEFSILMYVKEDGDASESDAENIAELILTAFTSFKYMNMDANEQQLMALMIPVNLKYTQDGENPEEETNTGVQILKMVMPALFGFILYFMLLFYGQGIAKNVLSEKSSKIMELMLTGVTPIALITGKVLALTVSAIVQFMAWVACGVLGYVSGDIVAGRIYEGYKNPLYEVIRALKEMGAMEAFSLRSIIFALITLCIGFLFYCVMAGLFGSLLSKPEELASVMGVYNIAVVAGFMVSYLGSLMEKKALLRIGRYVPFCSPFMLPADIMVGNMKMVEILISTAILLISTVIIIISTGKVYEMTVLYKGNGVKGLLRNIGKHSKASRQ